MNSRELLKKMGEETLYSAKGHFKSVDLRRIQTRWTIIGCFLLNVAGIIGVSEYIDKWFSGLGLLGTLFLFYWDAEEGKDNRLRHKQAGEAYLALHKEIRMAYFHDHLEEDHMANLHRSLTLLDSSNKPEISWVARKWAQKSIEKFGETDNWFQ